MEGAGGGAGGSAHTLCSGQRKHAACHWDYPQQGAPSSIDPPGRARPGHFRKMASLPAQVCASRGSLKFPLTFLPEKPILTKSELVGKYTDLMFEIDTSNSFVGSKKATIRRRGGGSVNYSFDPIRSRVKLPMVLWQKDISHAALRISRRFDYSSDSHGRTPAFSARFAAGGGFSHCPSLSVHL